MPSRIIPMEELEQRDVMYWLPPNGQDNGVQATMWIPLAEIDVDDVSSVLTKLADAGVGAFAAKRPGREPRAACHRRLYVDTTKTLQATDLLMLLLRGRAEPELADYRPPRRVPLSQMQVAPRSKGRHYTRKVVKYLLMAGMLVVLGLVIYQTGVNYYEGLQRHEPPAKSVPALHQSTQAPWP